MDFFHTDMIRPLDLAETQFLEVLLSNFKLSRETGSRGVRLEVAFDGATPAVWNRLGRAEVKNRMANHAERVSADYHRELRSVLVDGTSDAFEPADKDFPWRWASAGVLPIITVDSKEYYCLIYRDIFPIGWNIANGACDTRYELANPFHTMERELGEELVVVHTQSKTRYVLRGQDHALDRVEFEQFRRIWREQFPEVDLASYHAAELPLVLERGPDRVVVHSAPRGHELLANEIADCFVNINVSDFGIEVDWIARIVLTKDMVICDGEISAGRALNRPVGLFDTSAFNAALSRGDAVFRPDKFFWAGQQFDGTHFEHFFDNTLIPCIHEQRRTEPSAVRDFDNQRNRLGLCPVTDTIIRRYSHLLENSSSDFDAPLSRPYDAFIAYSGTDTELARNVFGLVEGLGLRAFFAPAREDNTPFNVKIYRALFSARFLLGVATSASAFQRKWFEFEAAAFHMLMMSEPNTRRRMVPIVGGIEPYLLPPPWNIYPRIDFTETRFDAAFRERLLHVLSAGSTKEFDN